MGRKTLKLIFAVVVIAVFLTIFGASLTQASPGRGIRQVIAQLQNDISNLAEKLESYYGELKSLISGSEAKISELNEKVETLEARVAELEQKVEQSKSPFPPISLISAKPSAFNQGDGTEDINVALQFGGHPYQGGDALAPHSIVWGVLHTPSGDVGSIGNNIGLSFRNIPIPPPGTMFKIDIYMFTAGALTHGTLDFIQPPM